jgi:hypothetical protein
MSTPYSENAVAPVTAPGKNSRRQLIGVMVRLRIPEDAIPEDAVQDVRNSIEFGEAEVSLAYICPPPPISPQPDTP